MMSDILHGFVSLSPLILASVAQASETAAQAPANDQFTVWWLLGLAGAAVMFNQSAQAWKTLTGRMQRTPDESQPRLRKDCIEVHKLNTQRLNAIEAENRDEHAALRHEFAAYQESWRAEVKTDFREVFNILRIGFENVASAAEERTSGLQQQINSVTKSAAANQAVIDQHLRTGGHS